MNIFEAADHLGAKEGISGEEFLTRAANYDAEGVAGQVTLNLNLDEVPWFLDMLSERGQALVHPSEVERVYSEKLDAVEQHFRTRIAEEQKFGGRMAAFAVGFFIWALIATSIAWWLMSRPGPGEEFRQVLNLRETGAERMNTMLLNVESTEQVEEALSLRAERTVKLMRAATDRAAAVTPAEQNYMAVATPLESEVAEIDEALEAYYKANKKTIEAEGKRRLETPLGVIGMRRTPAKLVPTKKGITWAKIVELIQGKYKGNKAKLEELLRVKVDPEKKALAKLTKEQLAELGCKVVSDDEFFVENTPASLEKFKAA